SAIENDLAGTHAWRAPERSDGRSAGSCGFVRLQRPFRRFPKRKEAGAGEPILEGGLRRMAQAVKHGGREGVGVLEVAPHRPEDLSDCRCTREDVSTAPKGLQGDESKSLLWRRMDNERRATVHLRKPGFAGPIHLHAGPKVRTLTETLIQGLEPWDSGVSDEMELVGNPIRNPLERLEGEPRLFDLPVNSHLDDEWRIRRCPCDRPESIFDSEGNHGHRAAR